MRIVSRNPFVLWNTRPEDAGLESDRGRCCGTTYLADCEDRTQAHSQYKNEKEKAVGERVAFGIKGGEADESDASDE